VLDRARGYAERELGVALTASGLSYNLFTRSIELRDLSLAATSSDQPFLQADRAVVVVGPGSYGGHLTVERISLSRPRVTVVRDSTGALNLPAARTDAPQSSPLQLGIVSTTALSIRLDDRLAQRSFTVGPFDLSIDTNGPASRPSTFGPGEFTIRAGQRETSGTIAGRLGFDGSRVRIEDLKAETREGRIALAGWADVVGERPAVSAKANATIDLPQSARFAGVDARGLSGGLEATIEVAGTLAAPALTVAVSSRDVRYPPIGPVRLSGRSFVSGNRAAIDALDIRSAAGSLQATGAIDLEEPPSRGGRPSSRLALRWADVRVDDLATAFGRSLPIRSGTLLTGSGTVDFDVRDLQDRDWSRLGAAATSTLQPDADASGPESLALAGSAELKVAEGRWSLSHSVAARRWQVDLAGDASGRLLDVGDGSTLAGRSRLNAADIGTLPALMEAAGVKLPTAAVEGLAGSMIATIDLGGSTGSPQAQIELDAREVRAQLLPHAIALKGQLTLDGTGVRADRMTATAGTAVLQGTGRYSFRGPFEARVELNEEDLSWIAGHFELPVPLSGSARIESAISGDGRAASAVYTLSARELAVDQVAIGPLMAKGSLSLAEGGPMTIDAAAPNVGGRARLEIVNRDGYPVSGEVALDSSDIGRLIPPRYREQVGDVSGKVSATARGSGLLSDPAGIRGRVDLRSLDGTAHGTRIVLAAPSSVTVTHDRIAVDPLELRAGERTRVTLAGQLGITTLPGLLRLHLEGPLAELIDIGVRAARIEPLLVRGEGSASLDVVVEGTLRHPRPNGNLVVRSPSIAYGTLAPATSLELDAIIDPTLITLRTLAAQWQGASLRSEGVLPWRVVLSSMQTPGQPAAGQTPAFASWLSALPAEPGRAMFTVRADNVTPAVLTDLVSADRLRDVGGSASATAAIEADRLSLERVQATAVLDRALLTVADVPFTQSTPTRVRLENGRASIEHFQWTAEGNSITASGGADLTAATPSMDVGISGALDLRVLGAFVGGIASGGTARADLRATGPLDNPEIVGEVNVRQGELQLDSPRLAATDVEGIVRIAAGRKATVALTGLVNTGMTRLDGTFDLKELSAPVGKLQITAQGIALEYPSGLQTESNVNLELALGAPDSTLTGRVDVLGGAYREPLVFSSQLFGFASASGIARTAPPPAWLARTRLNVAIATASDVRIDNNYGRLDVGAALRLVGTAANPGVLGRLQAMDDGEIYFGGNTYRIERLAIDLTNPRAITPDVTFAAVTRIGDLPISIELRCPPAGACERKVTSLATGVDDKEAEARLFGSGGDAESAGEGLARLLSGELLGVVGRTVGLDALRLEQGIEQRDIFDDPTLVAGDVDPAARLTLAKRLGSSVELIYSQNLADDGFTWITSYLGPYGLSGRLLVFDDQSRAYEFRHEPPIGAARPRQRPRPPGPRIAAVTITGDPGFPDAELRRLLKLNEGDRFAFADWQRDRDRLARFYHDKGYLETRIRARRLPANGGADQAPPGTSADDKVVLEYALTRGPATELNIQGAIFPDAVRDRIVGRWVSALFDGFLERDARAIVREHLYREGYLAATVEAAVALDASRGVKTLTIDVTPGAIVARRLDFTGNSALSTKQLIEVVGTDDQIDAWLDPRSVERSLREHYRAEGFLTAKVAVGAPAIRDGTSVVAVEVIEGAAYSIGAVDVSGLPDGLAKDARADLKLSTGDRYRPAGVAAGVDALEARLRRAAYRAASADVDTQVDAEAARVDVAVRVTPGPRSILRDVVVEGGDENKPPVARAIALEPGAPVDPAALRETRRRLYDLDVYRSVDIQIQPLAADALPGSSAVPSEQPVVARIALEERPRYRFRYGIAVSEEDIGTEERDTRLGFAADLENRNVFGRGMSAGLSLRLRRDQRVGRVTLGARRLFGLPIRSTLFLERSREQFNPEADFPTTSDITALTVEEAYRIGPLLELRHGYGIERNHTVIRSDGIDPFDLTVTVARFTTSGLADRRDDPFDPARGWFAASTLEYSGPRLGSDLRFLKDFAQYSHFVPVGRSLVVASAVRFGVARTFDDQVLIPSERFYAGGANTVRGYREDDLGPRSILDDAEGGSALLVLNGEVRFPIYKWLKGAAFVDMGNVYPKISDISLTDLQVGLGGGARLDTPFGLIRFDLGVPANPRSFDPRWRVHVGLGHAF
jgi:outer membrane protein insertion porin family